MNAFEELHHKKLINITDTFYVVNVFHDILWDFNWSWYRDYTHDSILNGLGILSRK